MASKVCPYCFEKIETRQIHFRCINVNPQACTHEPDARLAQYRRLLITDPMPRVFAVTRRRWLRAPTRATCPSCGDPSTKTICPHCHNELPTYFFHTRNYTLALIGAKDSGKSHYVAVLIQQLKNRVGRNFNAALNAMDDQTERRYRNDFFRYIQKGERIPNTVSARAHLEVRYPLVYRFTLQERLWGLFRRTRSMNLVFFDTAGEDLDQIDLMATETRYIANSDGLIFLLDPLQLPAVRDRLPDGAGLPTINTEPHEIIGRVIRLIRSYRELRPEAKIRTPVALAFSKIDEVRDLFEPGSPIHRHSAHTGAFDRAEAAQTSESMRAHLEEWGCASLDLLVHNDFKRFAYFGLSALGARPDARGRLSKGVVPFRVEDPLLWLLYSLGLIAGKKE